MERACLVLDVVVFQAQPPPQDIFCGSAIRPEPAPSQGLRGTSRFRFVVKRSVLWFVSVFISRSSCGPHWSLHPLAMSPCAFTFSSAGASSHPAWFLTDRTALLITFRNRSSPSEADASVQLSCCFGPSAPLAFCFLSTADEQRVFCRSFVDVLHSNLGDSSRCPSHPKIVLFSTTVTDDSASVWCITVPDV